MNQCDQLTVIPLSVFTNLESNIYPVGSKGWKKNVEKQKEWAGRKLTFVGKIGFSYLVDENDIVWSEWHFGN